MNQHLLTYQGETLTIAEWSRRTGLRHGTISLRLKRGWTVERALAAPLTRRGRKPFTPTLATALPSLVDYQRQMQAAHQQMHDSMHAFTRAMEQQMAQLRRQLDTSLATQSQQACNAVLHTHTPRVGQRSQESSSDQSPSSAQDSR